MISDYDHAKGFRDAVERSFKSLPDGREYEVLFDGIRLQGQLLTCRANRPEHPPAIEMERLAELVARYVYWEKILLVKDISTEIAIRQTLYAEARKVFIKAWPYRMSNYSLDAFKV